MTQNYLQIISGINPTNNTYINYHRIYCHIGLIAEKQSHDFQFKTFTYITYIYIYIYIHGGNGFDVFLFDFYIYVYI